MKMDRAILDLRPPDPRINVPNSFEFRHSFNPAASSWGSTRIRGRTGATLHSRICLEIAEQLFKAIVPTWSYR